MLSLRGCCVSVLLLSLTMAAPLEKGPLVPSSVNEVQKQEQELQSLLQLADEKEAQKDVTVHEEHVQHVHEINGHKMEVDTARKTVSDTKTGQVLSDVKQEVSKADEQSAGAAEPEVQVKTEVDVPEEGIHETIVQSGSEAEESPVGDGEREGERGEEEEEEELEFSPEAVADYLYRTGDFDRFYTALAQLVNASIMTEEEAQTYSQMVALEYDRIQMEDYENSILVQRRVPQLLERYPLSVDSGETYPLPLDSQEAFPVAMDTPEALFALERAQAASPKDQDLEFDPYDLLTALWNEAYGSGDVRAQALVGELFDKVRGDNDPDDEGQVRDILLDLIANSVMNEEAQMDQPEYGWQPMVEEDTYPMEPIREPLPLPAQPISDESEDEEAVKELLEPEKKRAAEQPISGQETKAAQPMESNNAQQPAEAQPIAASDAKADGQQTAEQEQSAQQKQAEVPEKLPTQKRAAETVPQA